MDCTVSLVYRVNLDWLSKAHALKAWSSACGTTGKWWAFRRPGSDGRSLWVWPWRHIGSLASSYVFCFLAVRKKAGLLGLVPVRMLLLSRPKATGPSDWTETVSQINQRFPLQGHRARETPRTGCLGFRPVQLRHVDKFLYFHTTASSRVKWGDCHRWLVSQLWGSVNI